MCGGEGSVCVWGVGWQEGIDGSLCACGKGPFIVVEPAQDIVAVFEVGFPTQIVVRGEEAVPFTIGVVVEPAVLALQTLAPRGEEHASIALEEDALCRRGAE